MTHEIKNYRLNKKRLVLSENILILHTHLRGFCMKAFDKPRHMYNVCNMGKMEDEQKSQGIEFANLSCFKK